MALSPGTSIGHYDVTALLGEGGMGQVWRATDTQLNRQVALKILPDAFATDPDRLARFTREAQILASLNHPNIAQIYGLEEDEVEGRRALVLELVEGPTLADRIAQGPIPLDEAIPIATQIAEALEAAHEQGVIHRDLKPANIKVKADDTVKVLDFGLAKAFQPDASDPNMSQSPTMSLTAAATQMGMVIGTAAYMAPEQARGRLVDKRADIFAFGVVLYEMLTGQRPFQGEDVSLTLAAVMTFDPDLDRLPDELPHAVGTYLERCLQKDPRQRIRDIGDVRLALEGAFETPVGVLSDTGSGAVARVGLRPAAVSLIALVTAIAAGLGVWLLTETDVAPADLMRFSIVPRETAPFGTGTPLQDLAVSADGSRIVYVSFGPNGSQLNLRPIDQLGGAPLRGGEGGAAPFVSPDGEWVGFVSGRTTLRKLSIVGGSPVTVTESPNLEIYGASWGTDDRIVFGTFAGGLFRVPGGGGEPEPVTSLDVEQGELGHLWPFTIGDRHAVLFAVRTSGGPGFSGFAGSLEFELAAVDLDTGDVRRLGLAGGSPRYLSTGHLVYAAEDGALRAAPFDVASLEVTGAPVSLVEGVLVKNTGAADFDVSRNGHLVYGTGSFEAIAASRELIWTSRTGEVETASAEPGPYRGIDLSPDGTRVTYGDGSDIWIEDLERGTSLKLTDGGGAYRVPMWTPDGERVAFGDWGSSGGLFWALADGAGEIERLAELPGALQPQPSGFTPNGETLLFKEDREGAESVDGVGAEDLFVLSLQDGTVAPLFDDAFSERNASVSPDGRWVAYQSNQSGVSEVYVRRFPDLTRQTVVSSQGGWSPLWGPGGRELFYESERGFVRVPVETASGFDVGGEEILFPYQFGGTNGVGSPRAYDVTLDGERFLSSTRRRPENDANRRALTVVLNWTQELLERVPVN